MAFKIPGCYLCEVDLFFIDVIIQREGLEEVKDKVNGEDDFKHVWKDPQDIVVRVVSKGS